MMKNPNILIICSWSYDNPLVHRYVLPYLELIKKHTGKEANIHLMTYETDAATQISNSKIRLNDIEITWVPVRYTPLSLRGWWLYLRQVMFVRKYCSSNQINVIHAFAPVAGAVAWLSSRISRYKFVLDSWEPHAEPMVETGVWKRSSMAFRILWKLEKWMAKDADYLIAAHREMVNYAWQKWKIQPRQIAYRPACVDTADFDPLQFNRERLRQAIGANHNTIICVCASQLGGMYYFDETLRFFEQCRQRWGNRFLAILLTSTPSDTIQQRAKKLGLTLDFVQIKRCAPHEVPALLAVGDFALNPQMAVPSKRYGTPVKNGEYWAMGLPIVMMKNTSQDSSLALEHDAGIVLENLTESKVSQAWSELEKLLCDVECRNRCRLLAIQTRSFALADRAYREVYGYTES